MRASPVDLWRDRRRWQRPVSACSMQYSGWGSGRATIVCAARTACEQGPGVGSSRSRRLTSTRAPGWREPSSSADAHAPATESCSLAPASLGAACRVGRHRVAELAELRDALPTVRGADDGGRGQKTAHCGPHTY